MSAVVANMPASDHAPSPVMRSAEFPTEVPVTKSTRTTIPAFLYSPGARRIAVLLLFVAAALTCYWPSLSGQFLWDDHGLVRDNPWIKSPVFVGEAFRHWLQPNVNSPYYRPIQTLSFMADYWVWGLKPFGFHLTNVLLQALCGFLLYRLLRVLLPKFLRNSENQILFSDSTALIVALLWTVHPIHNAAIAYVAGRADALGFIFGAAAALSGMAALNTQARRGTRAFCALLAAAFSLTAVCSKEISVSWIGLALVFLFGFASEVTLRKKVAVVVGALGVVILWWFLRHLPAEPSLSPNTVQTSWPQRVVLVSRAVGDYARLLVAPIDLHMERMVWPEWMNAHTTWSTVPAQLGVLGWTGIAVMAACVAGVLRKGVGQRLRVFGAIWFCLCFLPISNVFPLNAQVAEHWIYLASVGALLFMVGVWAEFGPRIRHATSLVVALAILLFGARTFARAYEWADPIRFYQQTITAMGGTPRTFNNLAVALEAKGESAQSEKVFRQALKMYPHYPTLLANLGNNLIVAGRVDEGKALLEQAFANSEDRPELGPRIQSQSDLALARLEKERGNLFGALEIVRKARSKFPNQWDLARLEAELLLDAEGLDAALAAVERYAADHWWHKDSRMISARMWARKGDPDHAIAACTSAARLDVWDAEPYAKVAEIEENRGNLLAACNWQEKAVRRSPDKVAPRRVLARLLHAAGNDEDAAIQLLDAREIEDRDKASK